MSIKSRIKKLESINKQNHTENAIYFPVINIWPQDKEESECNFTRPSGLYKKVGNEITKVTPEEYQKAMKGKKIDYSKYKIRVNLVGHEHDDLDENDPTE